MTRSKSHDGIVEGYLINREKKRSSKLYGSQICVVRYYTVFCRFPNSYTECHHSDHEVFACHALHFSLFILQSFSILRHERPIEYSWDWPSSNRFLHSAKGLLLIDCVKLPEEQQWLSN